MERDSQSSRMPSLSEETGWVPWRTWYCSAFTIVAVSFDSNADFKIEDGILFIAVLSGARI